MSHPLLEAVEVLTRTAATAPDFAAQLSRIRRLAGRAVEAKAALEIQVARYQTVLERALEVTTTSGLDPVAGKVIDGMLEVAGAKRGFVGLLERGGMWRVLVARNMEKGDIPEPEGKLSSSIIGEVLRTGQPSVSEDAGQDTALGQAGSVMSLGLRSVACLPLVWQERTIGFVYLDDTRSRGLFDEAALTAVRAWLPLAAEGVARARDAVEAADGPLGVPTRSKVLLAELERLARVARFDASILLTGETGTGKSMLARKIHEASPRAERPFVHINCGALPEALLESELFGSEAGAFTGAKGQRQGRFEAAEGGTIFLDELDTMPVACQVKLLVALQERTVTRLGSNTPIRVDVRVIAAMASEPKQAIAQGRIREDLYYRLAVVEVRLPALRERREDIPLIVRTLLESTARRYGLPRLHLTDRALLQLEAHDWPGNVRELQNAVDRAALFSNEGAIDEIQSAMGRSTPPGVPADEGVMGLLRRAARRYLDEIPGNPRLKGVDLLDGFRGVVVAEAIRRCGGREEAMNFLGEDVLVESRNHHRLIRRELDRLAAMEAAVGG